MRGENIDLGRGIDLSKTVGGEFVGECSIPAHPRIDRVIVALKNNGELSEEQLADVAEAAKVAAIAASRIR